MSSLNKCQFIGRLGKDPETRFTNTGDAVTNISIAVSEKWKDKQGQPQEKTEWVRVVAFKKLAEIMGEYLKKGSQVYIEGKMVTRKWQDQSGQDKYSTEINANQMIMLDSRGDSSEPSSNQADKQKEPEQQQSQGNNSFDNFDDDIPF